jgi:hypothetical protein
MLLMVSSSRWRRAYRAKNTTLRETNKVLRAELAELNWQLRNESAERGHAMLVSEPRRLNDVHVTGD